MSFETMLTQKQIAMFFSNGEFSRTYPFLDHNIEWNIVGDKRLVGKEAVLKECNHTSHYFKTITTHFNVLKVIKENNHIVINGTAEFSRNNKQLSYISACDVYVFNDKNMLQRIDSYCIKIK